MREFDRHWEPNPDNLTAPLRWRKAVIARITTDLFADFVPDEWIDKLFAVMALAPQHTFQVLTKRAARMREYFAAPRRQDQLARANAFLIAGFDAAACDRLGVKSNGKGLLPLPNVWLGISTERQEEADERIPHLLATPAAVRFASLEPLLGPIDLWNGDPDPRLGGHKATHTFLGDWWEPGDDPKGPSRHGLDWVIVGGESGPNARPSHPDWFRSLRDQCLAAEVPFFFKQWGEWGTTDLRGFGQDQPVRCGKKAAGRLLDGVVHDGMPSHAL